MKIYLTCFEYGKNVLGMAMGEDGHGLASHLSSNEAFSKHDMGLTSDWKHEHYDKMYPDGYELEWVDDAKTHRGWQDALVLNKLTNNTKK